MRCQQTKPTETQNTDVSVDTNEFENMELQITEIEKHNSLYQAVEVDISLSQPVYENSTLS